MPWRTSTVETERARFVLEAQLSNFSFSELCRRHRISRPTGYKWLVRYEQEGLDGLKDRSRRPRSCPHATPPEVVDQILEIRKRQRWGARKIQHILKNDPAIDPVPCVDTVHQVLQRHGLVEARKPRRRRSHPGPPLPIPEEPNATWTADFKGEFRTLDGNLCFPLTVQDGYTRFLLECRGMLRLDLDATMRRFRHLFRTHGLPQKIRTDNGHPFASTAIANISQLSVWWISLGIWPEFIEPASPYQNGRHERMHRTLKNKATLPPSSSLRAQQIRFNKFRRVFNHERPHEAIGMLTPADLYRSSDRRFTDRPDPLEYPDHFELRLVSQDASIRWKSRKVFVSSLLARRTIGLEQVGDRVWSAYFGPLHLGWLDEYDYRIMDVRERSKRRR